MQNSLKPGGSSFLAVSTCLTTIQGQLDVIPLDVGVIGPLKAAIGGLITVLKIIEVWVPSLVKCFNIYVTYCRKSRKTWRT